MKRVFYSSRTMRGRGLFTAHLFPSYMTALSSDIQRLCLYSCPRSRPCPRRSDRTITVNSVDRNLPSCSSPLTLATVLFSSHDRDFQFPNISSVSALSLTPSPTSLLLLQLTRYSNQHSWLFPEASTTLRPSTSSYKRWEVCRRLPAPFLPNQLSIQRLL